MGGRRGFIDKNPLLTMHFRGRVHTSLWVMICRDAVEALSAEIKSLLTGPLKGRRTGVAELRKKMESQSDAQVSCRGGFALGKIRRSLLAVSYPEI